MDVFALTCHQLLINFCLKTCTRANLNLIYSGFLFLAFHIRVVIHTYFKEIVKLFFLYKKKHKKTSLLNFLTVLLVPVKIGRKSVLVCCWYCFGPWSLCAIHLYQQCSKKPYWPGSSLCHILIAGNSLKCLLKYAVRACTLNWGLVCIRKCDGRDREDYN